VNVVAALLWGAATVAHLIGPPMNPLPLWVYTGLLCLMNVTAAMDANLRRAYRKALGLQP
jgi:hypothetical protein